eukprot:m.503940 g.503940  ORF g.503940 m.503940 type:complete len:83 (+) comp57349_c0_seq9:271-519(+)
MCLQWVLQCLGLRPRTQKYAQFPRSRKHHDDTLLQTFEDDSEEERSHFEDRILASSPMYTYFFVSLSSVLFSSMRLQSSTTQ